MKKIFPELATCLTKVNEIETNFWSTYLHMYPVNGRRMWLMWENRPQKNVHKILNKEETQTIILKRISYNLCFYRN